MIKVKAINDFKFSSMDKIKNLVRTNKETPNFIYKNDIFECDKKMCDYLTGNNEGGFEVVKIIEYKPKK